MSTTPENISGTTIHEAELETSFKDNLARRRVEAAIFKAVILLATFFAMAILATLVWRISAQGWAWLNWNFMTSFPSRVAARAGILSALVGSATIILLTVVFAVMLGVGAAIYLEELSPKNKLSQFIELNISNLSGVPSLVYGMLGLAVFVRLLGFGRSIMAAACTLAMMILPIIIISSREALRTVPPASDSRPSRSGPPNGKPPGITSYQRHPQES